MIYITGDTHRDFSRIGDFCRRMKTKKSDIMIVLGDAGINYYGNFHDAAVKSCISSLPITLFCIHGNHEMRPESMPKQYRQMFFHGGSALFEEEYPNIIFGLDGEVYDFNGLRTMVIGGAYSVDKYYRLERGAKWFADEQPSEEIKTYVRNVLNFNGNDMDVFLTHTCPKYAMPVEDFLPGIDQSTVDNSTEEFLEEVAKTTKWKVWKCGHFHTDKISQVDDKIQFLFNDIIEFPRRKDLDA